MTDTGTPIDSTSTGTAGTETTSTETTRTDTTRPDATTRADAEGASPTADVVVFLPGAGVTTPMTPISEAEATVDVADLAVTRGDGIFESIGVIDGRFIELPRHLRRLAHSAELLELPEPDLEAFEAAARLALEAHAPAAELLVKLFHSRGVERSTGGVAGPTGWVQVLTGADHAGARATGIRVVTLDRGYRHDIAQTAPWLLQGAKTLSYALNKAALREAGRRNADDVIFVSTDDVVLEGPTANVLVRHGDLFRTPRTDLGILAGTTQAAAFEVLESFGFDTGEAVLTTADLVSADAIWLCSSGRLLAPVRELDGRTVPVDAELTTRLLATAFGLHPSGPRP